MKGQDPKIQGFHDQSLAHRVPCHISQGQIPQDECNKHLVRNKESPTSITSVLWYPEKYPLPSLTFATNTGRCLSLRVGHIEDSTPKRPTRREFGFLLKEQVCQLTRLLSSSTHRTANSPEKSSVNA